MQEGRPHEATVRLHRCEPSTQVPGRSPPWVAVTPDSASGHGGQRWRPDSSCWEDAGGKGLVAVMLCERDPRHGCCPLVKQIFAQGFLKVNNINRAQLEPMGD